MTRLNWPMTVAGAFAIIVMGICAGIVPPVLIGVAVVAVLVGGRIWV